MSKTRFASRAFPGVTISILLVLSGVRVHAQPAGEASGIAAFAAREPYEYTIIDGPGATATTAFGVSATAGIVGVYTDANGRQHGFRRRDDSIDTIDYPGAVLTAARGISAKGVNVGSYRKAGEPAVNVHGYILSTDRVFHAADYPGHTNTIPQRILPSGTILGCYHDSDTMMSMHGMALWDGGNADVDMPASMSNGALPDRSVTVGFYTDMMANRTSSFVVAGGAFHSFDYPEATMTQAWDINAAGTIVGFFQDATTRIRGFVLTDGRFRAIDFPEALETRAFGIDEDGNIVGSFLDASRKTHAFLASHKFITPRDDPRDKRQ